MTIRNTLYTCNFLNLQFQQYKLEVSYSCSYISTSLQHSLVCRFTSQYISNCFHEHTNTNNLFFFFLKIRFTRSFCLRFRKPKAEKLYQMIFRSFGFIASTLFFCTSIKIVVRILKRYCFTIFTQLYLSKKKNKKSFYLAYKIVCRASQICFLLHCYDDFLVIARSGQDTHFNYIYTFLTFLLRSITFSLSSSLLTEFSSSQPRSTPSQTTHINSANINREL